MRRLAALLVLWAPLASGASTLRAVPRVSFAPAPALAVPAALPSAALAAAAPALIAPPAIVAPSFATLPALPVAAAVPSAAAPALSAPALAAVARPAAAGPDEDGGWLDETGEAARRRFDGAAARRPYEHDEAVVTGPVPVERRSSGLSPPGAGEVEAAYRVAARGSTLPDALRAASVPFAPFAAEALRAWTFLGDGMFRRPMSFFERVSLDQFIGAVQSPASRDFQSVLGRWLARAEAADPLRIMEAMMGVVSRGHLPENPLGRGAYWDIASGMNAAGMIRGELDGRSDYAFIDANPFVASYLRETADLARARGARVLEGDVNALTRPAEPLAVLRVKNAAAYVPGFAAKLEAMADWIAPGGRLAIQNDPNPGQRHLIREKHGPLIRRLLEEGWTLSYSFARSPSSSFVLDTILLDRPSGEAARRSPAEAAAVWAGWLRASAYADAR